MISPRTFPEVAPAAFTATASIVIPAHNEAAVIARCLSELAPSIEAGEFDVVVVCNGCTDETAEIARGFPRITVLELELASKAAALRAAEAMTTVIPRIYLDSDVVLPVGAARAVVAMLTDGATLACRPRIRYDFSDASWPVRRYYAARTRLPSVMSSLWGAGVYATSAVGRARFDQFPDVVADDLWVDSLYERSDILISPGPPVSVVTPRRAADLLKILRRAQRGKIDAAGRPVAGGADRGTSGVRSELVALARSRPSATVDAAVYAVFAVLSRITASRATSSEWERDDSSRQRG